MLNEDIFVDVPDEGYLLMYLMRVIPETYRVH